MEFDNGGFSIREYTSHIRTVDIRKCWPFAGEITEDIIQSILPPLSVAKFRWWSHELTSLLTKSPVSVDHDSDSNIRRKSKPRKKRSVFEICATAPPKFELSRNEDDSDLLIGSRRKRTNDHVLHKKIKISGYRKFAIKVSKYKEQAQEKVDCENYCLWNQESSDVMSLRSKMAGSVSKFHGSEFQIPPILKEKQNVCLVKSPDHAPQFERYQSGNLSHVASIEVELCCLELNRLSLSSTEDQSPVNDNQMKVMHLESRQQDMFQPAGTERYVQEETDLSCCFGPYLSSQERVKEALDMERKGHLAQPIQSLISTRSESPYRSGYSFSRADMHWGTWLYQSPIDP